MPAEGIEQGRTRASCRQRAPLGEGDGQDQVRVDRPMWSRSPSRSGSAANAIAPHASVPRRAWPRPSTHATSTWGSHSEWVGRIPSGSRPPRSPSRAGRADSARGQPPRSRQAAIRRRCSQAGPSFRDRAAVIERHPQIGFRMLELLGVDPRSPNGYCTTTSAGTAPAIRARSPVRRSPGAKDHFVADAYDAMTSDRIYRERFSDSGGAPRARALLGTDRSDRRGGARRGTRGREREAVAVSA